MAQYYDYGQPRYSPEPRYNEPRYVEPRRYERGIGEGEAISIARNNGMARVVRVTGGNNVWRLTGLDRRGYELRMVIDARTGRVVAAERDR
ncbi:MAG: hypothetical protein K2X62_13860 [Beijerinckiaceae bacterium]|nr:hypothetical protein [Beijerinckiaceae bacterium]